MDFAGKNVVVTGAAGAIGFETCKQLLIQGVEVYIINNNNYKYYNYHPTYIHFVFSIFYKIINPNTKNRKLEF